MQINIYSIKDNKAARYGVIFTAQDDVCATRHFAAAIKDPQIQLSLFPEDFDLYSLGSYDNDSGKVEAHPNGTQFIVSGTAFKKLQKKENDDA